MRLWLCASVFSWVCVCVPVCTPPGLSSPWLWGAWPRLSPPGRRCGAPAHWSMELLMSLLQNATEPKGRFSATSPIPLGAGPSGTHPKGHTDSPSPLLAGPGRPVEENLLQAPVVPEAPWAGREPGHATRGSANPGRCRGVSGPGVGGVCARPETAPHAPPPSRLLSGYRSVSPCGGKVTVRYSRFSGRVRGTEAGARAEGLP